MVKYDGTNEDDRASLGSKVLEALTDDAFQIALDFGRDRLKQPDGVLELVDAMKMATFPLKEAEAKELYHAGQKPGGIMSRQPGESVIKYISRRRRWWNLLQKLDSKTQISENLLADMLLDHSGLNDTQMLMIKTSCNNTSDFTLIADALVKQHPKIRMTERRINKSGTAHSGPWQGKRQ